MSRNSLVVLKRPNEHRKCANLRIMVVFVRYKWKKARPSEAATSGSSSTVSPVPSQNHELAFMRCSRLLHARVKAYPEQSHNLLRHLCAMSWNHANLHVFQSIFYFLILKTRFLTFVSKEWLQDVWNSFPFIPWGIVRTQIWIFQQLLPHRDVFMYFKFELWPLHG